MTGHADLQAALAALLEAGDRPPCAGQDAWTSDDRDERDIAARLCRPCPLIPECQAAADSSDEAFGVWAARDRGPASKRGAA